ncbi:MAG: alpha/beta fold hydrolase [Planctomycetes bacterium]|nr:alpha/beta fold hydrolase [Planctomycetota bacterium]
MRIAPTLVAAALFVPLAGLAFADKPVPSSPSNPSKAAGAAAADTTKREVQIPVDATLTLSGTLLSPTSSKQGAPAALMIHDAGGSRDDVKDLADRLFKQGFFVLTVDLRGHGQSATPENDFSKLDDSAKAAEWAASVADVKASLAFLREQPGVQVASLSLVGYRAGCTLVTRYALRDEAIRAIALVDPQAEQFGLSVMKDVEGLGGLPTLVVLPKGDDRSEKRLVEAASRATSAKNNDAMTVMQSKETGGTTLADKRVPAEVVKWLQSRVNPQKSKS